MIKTKKRISASSSALTATTFLRLFHLQRNFQKGLFQIQIKELPMKDKMAFVLNVGNGIPLKK